MQAGSCIYTYVCIQKHTCTLCCLPWANRKQAEARSKTCSQSRNCTFKKVAGSRQDTGYTIDQNSGERKDSTRAGVGQHQAGSSSVQEAWLQEAGTAWPWHGLRVTLRPASFQTPGYSHYHSSFPCSLGTQARHRHYSRCRVINSVQMMHKRASPAPEALALESYYVLDSCGAACTLLN